MSTAPAQNNTAFPVSFTAASLRPELARIVAQAYLDCGDWELARQHVLEQNLLQSRSRASAIRMEREFRQRLQTLTPRQLEILAQAPSDARRAVAWLAVLKHTAYVFEFAAEVLRPKLEHLDTVIRPSDYEGFFDTQVAEHPELADLTASTRVKIRNVLLVMLHEAGIITGPDKDLTFARPIIPPEVLDAIVSDDPRWLAGFLVPDGEIRSLAR
jgi:hypothetical protein